MEKKIIILCYRKIIRPGAINAWDKLVHEDSYMEFKMQAQNFSAGTNITGYAELLRNTPDAQQLAARVAPSIAGYVQQFGGVIPEILNALGRRFLKFKHYQFEIINSDINDRDKHTIAINFYSEPMMWHDTIGDKMLVSVYTDINVNNGEETLTDLFQLQPYLNIHSVTSLLKSSPLERI